MAESNGVSEVSATYKGARISARKVRLVVDRIRGKKVEDALKFLKFNPKKAAFVVQSVLDSAVANAEHNEGFDLDELKVSTVYVDEGTTMKRIRPRAKGRADRIFKRSCHVTVKVSEV